MIDIENEVITLIADSLATGHPEVLVTNASGHKTYEAEDFPILTVEETNNTTYEPTLTSDHGEQHARIVYSFNAYSNKEVGARAECKAILAVVDNAMASIGFMRTAYGELENLFDRTITRMVSQYSGIVSTEKVVYRK